VSTKSTKFDYQAKNDQLEKIITEMQDPSADIDKSIKNYESGLQLIKELEAYLVTAENNILELKAKFNKDK